MTDPNDVYKNQFNRQQLDQFDNEFENGIPDDDDNDANGTLVIKTPGAQKRTAPEFVAPSRPIFTGSLPKMFTFSMSTATRINDPRFGKSPKKKKAPPKKKKARTRDSDYGVSETTDDDEVADGTEPTTPFSRNLRPRNIDVASKEVVEDGGATAAPPVKFVSLNQASRNQSKRNIQRLIEENDDLCDSSCDSLEQRIAELDAEEDRKNRRSFLQQYTAMKKIGKIPPGGIAPESFDEASFSAAGSREASRKRTRSQLDDDDDMYDSDAERTASRRKYKGPDDSTTPHASRSATREEASRPTGGRSDGGGGGGGGGGNDKVTGRDYRPGRSISSSLNCFLCRFGNRETDAISRPDMDKLTKTLESGIGHTDPVTLARQIHLQYMNTIFRDGRLNDQRLPVWRTKNVLEHILYHENDPRYFLWLSIINSKRKINCLTETAFVEHPVTGADVPSKSLELATKEEDHLLKLYNSRPENMNFYQAQAQIDLGKNNRRVQGLSQKRVPRHYAHTVIAEVDER